MSEHEHLKVDSLEAREITLRHPNGGPKVTLSAAKDVAGVWLSTPKGDAGPLVAIYANETMVAVGLYPAGKKEGCAIALSVDDKGEPYVQLRDPRDGKITMLSLDDLLKLGG
jgi:hypothetical protein